MAVLETIKRFATGKTATQRARESAVEKIIREKSQIATLKEREIQNVRLAREKVRINAERKITAMKEKSSGGISCKS